MNAISLNEIKTSANEFDEAARAVGSAQSGKHRAGVSNPYNNGSDRPDHEHEVVARLRAAYGPLLSSPGDTTIEDSQIPAIERIVCTAPDDPDWVQRVIEQLPFKAADASQSARCAWECRREIELVDRVLAGTASLSNYLFYAEAQRLIDRELNLLPKHPRNVLLIGSGPLPLSGVLIHEITGARVTCLDCDSDAIDRSRQLLIRLGMNHAIRVCRGYGEEVNVRPYDLTVIALLAQPKEKILSNVSRTISLASHVMCRTSVGLRALLYKPTETAGLSTFRRVGEQTAYGGLAVSTILLRPAADNVRSSPAR